MKQSKTNSHLNWLEQFKWVIMQILKNFLATLGNNFTCLLHFSGILLLMVLTLLSLFFFEQTHRTSLIYNINYLKIQRFVGVRKSMYNSLQNLFEITICVKCFNLWTIYCYMENIWKLKHKNINITKKHNKILYVKLD